MENPLSLCLWRVEFIKSALSFPFILDPHSSFTDIQDGYTERLSFENPMQETMKSVKSEEGRDIDSFDVKVAKR